MSEKTRLNWAPLVILGSLWGLSEAALGMGLRQCASTVSGSLMTGVAFLFLATAWMIASRVPALILVVACAIVFKLFDAVLLGLPLSHGAIGNPIFAILMEGVAFFLIITVVRRSLARGPLGQGLVGAFGALVAVNLFPLVKFATGVPACVVPGTAYPLSLYYAPLAVIVSSITVPIGFWLGAQAANFEARTAPLSLRRLRWISPAAFALCLVALALLRRI